MNNTRLNIQHRLPLNHGDKQPCIYITYIFTLIISSH